MGKNAARDAALERKLSALVEGGEVRRLALSKEELITKSPAELARWVKRYDLKRIHELLPAATAHAFTTVQSRLHWRVAGWEGQRLKGKGQIGLKPEESASLEKGASGKMRHLRHLESLYDSEATEVGRCSLMGLGLSGIGSSVRSRRGASRVTSGTRTSGGTTSLAPRRSGASPPPRPTIARPPHCEPSPDSLPYSLHSLACTAQSPNKSSGGSSSCLEWPWVAREDTGAVWPAGRPISHARPLPPRFPR